MRYFLVCGLLFLMSCTPDSKIDGELTPSNGNNDNNALAGISLGYGTSYTWGVGVAVSVTPSQSRSGSIIAAISPSLPTGLSLDPLTGVISGTPTTASSATTYTVYIAAEGQVTTSTFSALVDNTAPSSVVISDGTIQQSTTSVSFTWTAATDAESGVTGYEYAIATTTTGTDIVNWTLTTSTSASLTGLSLSAGTYYTRVRAINGAGQKTAVVSDGFNISPNAGSGSSVAGVWLGQAYYGDNSRTIFGLMFCTPTGCLSYDPSNQYSSNAMFYKDGANVVYSQTWPSPTVIVCNVAAGCMNYNNFPTNGSHWLDNIISGLSPSMSWMRVPGTGTFRNCSYVDGTCTDVSAGFTEYLNVRTTNYIWGQSGSNLAYLTGTTVSTVSHTSPAAVAANLSADGVWTKKHTSTTTTEIYYCTTTSCSLLNTITHTANLYPSLLGGNNRVWVYGAGKVNTCTTSACVEIGTGYSTSLSAVGLNKVGSRYWFISSGVVYTCDHSSCASTGTSAVSLSADPVASSTGIWAVTGSNPYKVFYCSGTSCAESGSFTGNSSTSFFVPNKSISGVWLRTATSGVVNYCGTTAASCVSLGAHDYVASGFGNYIALDNLAGDAKSSAYASSLFFLDTSWNLKHCSPTACSTVTTFTLSGDNLGILFSN